MEAAIDDPTSEPQDPDTAAPHTSKKRRKHHTKMSKREALRAIGGLSQCQAAEQQGVPRWTLNDWRRAKDNISSYSGSEKRLSRGPGRKEMIPFSKELVTFMKDTRRNCEVPAAKVMAGFVKEMHADWLESYLEDKKDVITAYDSQLRLLRRFAYRHGFSQRTSTGLKGKLHDLVAVLDEVATTFSPSYGSFYSSSLYNTDETGIYFDCPPSKMLSEKGKTASITAEQKHSARLTAVCIIRADSQKLPLLFIVRGESGGIIEQEELNVARSVNFFRRKCIVQ